MSRPIHEKINQLLTERGQKKKDLAKALGISPQTMTDIVKGRSSVTLSHLKGLVRFFDLRADYWIDDEREGPEESDVQSRQAAARADGDSARTGILRTSQQKFLQKLRTFLQNHEEEWNRFSGPLDRQEKDLLGIREDLKESESKGEPLGDKGVASSE
jgi:transcriptional regulator with XRE-family HTH domain